VSSKFYTTAQAAEKVGVSRQTIQAWLTAGRIAPPKDQFQGAAVRLWTESDLARLEQVKQKSRARFSKKGKKSKA